MNNSAIPDEINSNHVLQAMINFDQRGYPAGYKSSTVYDILHKGRRYPPPAIIALAIKTLTGTTPPLGIPAGKGSKCFKVIRACGFEIVRKDQPDTSE